ncbi:hypothetical protein EJ08DRAFT_698907 [Tothia fuscella]|uniref:peptidylprolyl isomerase n=1 Tax=Tothia fuscella TaxID=1048955 RepID=A0A9P4NPE3_9PEZI|nr:hypothetical protein EJ08DRAFT_698907 [Tothia fuscella]
MDRTLLSITFLLLVTPTTLTPVISARSSSSCNNYPHFTEKVTWTTTQCAFCSPLESKANQTLWLNYNGTLTNGTLFDSSYTAEKPWPLGDPFNFTLGSGQVIQGFDAGLYDMCPGEKRKLVIPPKYGYGEKGVPGAIPPNATLTFNVELTGIGAIQNRTFFH